MLVKLLYAILYKNVIYITFLNRCNPLSWGHLHQFGIFLLGCLETKLDLGYFFLNPGRNEGRKSLGRQEGRKHFKGKISSWMVPGLWQRDSWEPATFTPPQPCSATVISLLFLGFKTLPGFPFGVYALLEYK